jgi:hypothetical protein
VIRAITCDWCTYCVSKKTTEAETRYHSARLELLAVVWSVERLRSLLIGIPFKVVTDCQAIVYLNRKRSINPQVVRWFEYDYTVEYRKGDRMAHVDSLSRGPVEQAEDAEDFIFDRRCSVLMIRTLTGDHMAMVQWADERLRTIIDLLRQPKVELNKIERESVKNYELINNKLYVSEKVNGDIAKLYVVPNSMRKSVVVHNHDLVGHGSVDRTVGRIKRQCWFRGMRRYVRRHVALVLLERLLSGPLPDLVLGGVVVTALIQLEFALFSVLLAADFLGEESRLDGFIGGFKLLSHKIVQRFLVVNSGAGKKHHNNSQNVVYRF